MEVEVATPTHSPGATPTIHTPPAPLHGYADTWEPYSPRKSARLSQRAAANRTPSPHLPTRHFADSRGGPSLAGSSLGSPRSSKSHSTAMASPVTSPRKKRMPAMESSRRASGALTAEGTAEAAAALGLAGQPDFQPGRASISAAGGMLITPAKTPQKAPTEQHRAKVRAVARTLFNESEIMPSPKKARTQKYTLDSFTADNDVEEPIEIYTDSHERIPEVDRSSDNPFYGDHPALAPGAPRRSKRQTVSIPGEGQVPVDEAIRREDGMVYVFRGKKKFRKFAGSEGATASTSDGAAEADVESRPRRPLARNSIKPRLLFAAKTEEPKVDTDEEEAATDIEDHAPVDAVEDEAATPMDLVDATPGTPEAPKFAPASPPTTQRATRFGGKRSAESTPMKPKEPKEIKETKPTSRGKRSPFDGWRRVKGGSESHGQKRAGDELQSGSTKRTRV